MDTALRTIRVNGVKFNIHRMSVDDLSRLQRRLQLRMAALKAAHDMVVNERQRRERS